MSDDANLIELTADIVLAYVSQNNIRTEDVAGFIASTHAALKGLTTDESPEEETPAETYTPAVTVRKSLASKDQIISLIDGRPYKTLRRHLSLNGLTPEQYRERYKLSADYPMTAPAYSEMRRAMAKTIGLGRKPGAGRKGK